MNIDERKNFEMEVQQLFDEYLMKTESRGISWGEIANIQRLTDAELVEIMNELQSEEIIFE